jgi:hypothetical protein
VGKACRINALGCPRKNLLSFDEFRNEAPADARIVIGAMIIKHKQKLDDREAIETILENKYMQYFLGLREEE